MSNYFALLSYRSSDQIGEFSEMIVEFFHFIPRQVVRHTQNSLKNNETTLWDGKVPITTIEIITNNLNLIARKLYWKMRPFWNWVKKNAGAIVIVYNSISKFLSPVVYWYTLYGEIQIFCNPHLLMVLPPWDQFLMINYWYNMFI